jgi:Lrp/AsnC family leucine-responsive transcriptional regulator
MADDKRSRRETSPLPKASAADGRRPLAGIAEAVGTPTPRAKLDPIDVKILSLLAADSRTSQRALARELHMSPPAIGERLARLERVGVIRGYTLDVDWSAVGFGTGVYLAVTAGTDQGDILTALHAIPEVQSVAVVTGSMDLLARVRVRDHEHLRRLLFERVWTIEGVERTETFLCLAEMPAKQAAAGLLAMLEQEHLR